MCRNLPDDSCSRSGSTGLTGQHVQIVDRRDTVVREHQAGGNIPHGPRSKEAGPAERTPRDGSAGGHHGRCRSRKRGLCLSRGTGNRRHRGHRDCSPPRGPLLLTGRRCTRPALQEHPPADRRRPPGPGCGISPAGGWASPLTSLVSGTNPKLLLATAGLLAAPVRSTWWGMTAIVEHLGPDHTALCAAVRTALRQALYALPRPRPIEVGICEGRRHALRPSAPPAALGSH